ncbi:hypothetical protein [Streptomyces sp. NPDC087270]|uniref:hypothetical protein n=1 Tax=Streptomyces sp. NPDC087270 TaxID=3365774 RepID=UPI003809F033
MKDRPSRKGGRLLDVFSQRRRMAKYTDPGAHMRAAPGRDASLPVHHTRTSVPPTGPYGG